jgi:predicted naringenin-chalcone synthase
MGLNNGERRKIKSIFKASGIEFRHTVLEDYGKNGDFEFYPNAHDFEPFPSTQKRAVEFRKNALCCSIQAVQSAIAQVPNLDHKAITHLIVVCCTGMYAPGLDIDLVNHLNLSSGVHRVCINFMGCYAAFNALRVADAFCNANADAKVLIVCTELCSLHFQKTISEDNILANALFADGSAAVIMEGTPSRAWRLNPIGFQSDLFPAGETDMAWTMGDFGFEMKLSKYVPGIIQGGIKNAARQLLARIEADVAAIKYFAIHPGGKKILEVIEEELGIPREKNAHAYDVLRNYGNMSSPTVLFVLKKIMDKLQACDHHETIMSFAFGPGLTVESLLLKIETR